MTIVGTDLPRNIPDNDLNLAVPRAAHPTHLHGYDFALLAQSNQGYKEEYANSIIKRDNSSRRDVALLPAGEFLVVASKADNPRTWLL